MSESSKKNRLFLHSIFLFVIFSLCINSNTFSQAGLDISNLQTVNVDALSDNQIRDFVSKGEEKGMTLFQLETLARLKGMPETEIKKLRSRIDSISLSNTTITVPAETENTGRIEAKGIDKKESDVNIESRIFGYTLFNSANLTFEPSLNIPTPKNYQIGPGDEIVISIWGASQQSYNLTVNPEGIIFIDKVGPININGLTITHASKTIIDRLSSIYSGLGQNTFAQVSLGNLRSIKVTLLGDVRMPGTYTLSSLSTVFNALYVSGGPNSTGSFRNIEIFRENKLFTMLDVYDFLVHGDQENNIRLQDQDIIRIKPYSLRVEIKGEIKKPGLYEMVEEETLEDAITFAGGYTDKAYTNKLNIVRNTPKELKIITVDSDSISSFQLYNGDIITVGPILERYENRVEIEGAVYRPGIYALSNDLTVKKLIAQADGLKDDVYLSRANILRTHDDYTFEIIPFDLAALINNSTPDITLLREDVIRIYSIYDLQEEFSFSIEGEIQRPGKYMYTEKTTLEDLIIEAGGFKESASMSKIEIVRRVKNPSMQSRKIAETYLFSVTKDLNISDSASSFILEPFDMIFVRRIPGYESQNIVQIGGEVMYPGKYALTTKYDRISDLISRTGGFAPDAYIDGAQLIRKMPFNKSERKKTLTHLENITDESIEINTPSDINQYIAIDLNKIMNKPHSKYDLLLKPGDVLFVPKELQTVKVTGATWHNNTIRYDKLYSFRKYISMSGGFSPEAKKSMVYILYANGLVDKTNKIVFFNNYPKVKPGAEIIVPQKIKRERKSAQEILGITTGISALAMVILAISNTIK